MKNGGEVRSKSTQTTALNSVKHLCIFFWCYYPSDDGL